MTTLQKSLAQAVGLAEKIGSGAYSQADRQHLAGLCLRIVIDHGPEIEAAVRDQWQPIETAPTEINELTKCGEPVLLGGQGWVETGFYHDGSDCYGHRGEAGWFALEDWGKDKLLCASNIYPTHWRPLPAPPAMQADGGGRGDHG